MNTFQINIKNQSTNQGLQTRARPGPQEAAAVTADVLLQWSELIYFFKSNYVKAVEAA